ncbi:hypothetical protein HDU67_008893 [Dinochytrium kinnereticum]|nr:hypothetical protein HDU67_008893 [Dinochytrium kinnereticum]
MRSTPALIALSLCALACSALALPQTVALGSPLFQPQTTSCAIAPVRETCDFYFDCLDVAKPCGPKGYVQSYGGLFCKKFKANVGKFSVKGQQWIWDVMQCLQNFLVTYASDPTATCSKIRDDAFKSHANCYLNGGISVCDLTIFDWIALVKTIGLPTLVEIRTIMSQVEVGSKCALGYIEDVLNFFKDSI